MKNGMRELPADGFLAANTLRADSAESETLGGRVAAGVAPSAGDAGISAGPGAAEAAAGSNSSERPEPAYGAGVADGAISGSFAPVRPRPAGGGSSPSSPAKSRAERPALPGAVAASDALSPADFAVSAFFSAFIRRLMQRSPRYLRVEPSASRPEEPNWTGPARSGLG